MNFKDDIKKILEIAVNAPSGHNSQPWKFVVKDDSIFLLNEPNKDKTLFNHLQKGSLIAHGAVIENIFIAASKEGYRANLNLFPKRDNSNLIAEIKLEKSNTHYQFEHLYANILGRTTNRKRYAAAPLKEEDGMALAKFINALVNYKIILLQERSDIDQVAGPFSMGDRLLFDNFYLHHALFSNVNWTLREERQKKEGLYVGTKELNVAERVVFKFLLGNWTLMKKLRMLGLAKKAAQKREKLYQRCSAIGLIVAPDNSPESFIESGRILQKLWLIVTSLGASFQPVSVGLLYLAQRVQSEDVQELTASQVEYVKSAYAKIKNIFGVFKETPTFSFRIGYADPPTASSLKKAPEIVFS